MTTPAHILPPTVPPKTSSTRKPPFNLLFRPPQVWDVCIRLSKCPGRYRSNVARGLGLIWRPGNLIRFCVPVSRIAPAALHYLDRPLITSLLLTWCCGPLYWTVLPPGRLTANDRRSLILLDSYSLFPLSFDNETYAISLWSSFSFLRPIIIFCECDSSAVQRRIMIYIKTNGFFLWNSNVDISQMNPGRFGYNDRKFVDVW